ncbi:MAG TPA: nitrite reductase (NAD(P)H) small subunit [Candidatus Kapabacteria bacterium]|nr:nitrite reductase (NAD(P)H) small subunit [Candidatus Kapabacteria bacterium]
MSDEIDDSLLEAARRELNGRAAEAREFEYACPVSEIPETGGKAIVMEDGEVALFHLGGEIFAISNLCPHEMSPLLAAGMVDREARTVTCPLHGWTFEIPTGTFLGVGDDRSQAGGSIPAYDVQVDRGEVWIRRKES